jgi:hypothetical protein
MVEDSDPQTPWQRANAQRESLRQEQRLARLPGGRKQVNSGRGPWWSKRDNQLRGYADFLVEARHVNTPGRRSQQSYTITEVEFAAIERNAFSTPPGCLPAMQIDIGRYQLFVIRLEDHVKREAELKAALDEIDELRRAGNDRDTEVGG